MTCNRCGGLVDMKDSSGGVTSGPFREEYQCLECGAAGSITGNAGDDPRNWNKSGSAFQ